MKYRKAVLHHEAIEQAYPYLVCNTIDTKNRMNPTYIVRGLRFEHLMIKLKSQHTWQE